MSRTKNVKKKRRTKNSKNNNVIQHLNINSVKPKSNNVLSKELNIDNIKCISNNISSREYIHKLSEDDKRLESNIFINSWLNEDVRTKCYLICTNNIVKNIALLSKLDFDPENQYTIPYTLNYIYTFPEYRNKGLAYKMLRYIKNREQLTAFVDDEQSNLFNSAGYKCITKFPMNTYRSQ